MAINSAGRRAIKKAAGKVRVVNYIRNPKVQVHRTFGKRLDDIKTHHETTLMKRTNQGKGMFGRTRARNVKVKGEISRWMKETDDMAKKFGFKDEKDFAQYIRRTTDANDVGLKRIKSQLWKYAKNHKSSLAKAALATGTAAGLLSYLKEFQRNNTGCFRYVKGTRENNLIRYKFEGNFCNSDTFDESENVKILPERDHPLFGRNKWDCGYNQFLVDGSSDSDRDTVYNIVNLGCNGLCDWANFNRLALLTSSHQPVEFTPEEEEEHGRYVYTCESTTLLRGLSESFGNVVSDTITGLGDSRLVANFNHFLYDGMRNLCKLLVIVVIGLFLYRLAVKPVTVPGFSK